MPDAGLHLRYVLGLLSLLPPGRGLTRRAGTNIYQLAEGLALELARVDERADAALREMIPWRAVDMLPDWEALLGITSPATLLEDRQAAVLARLRGDGPPTFPGFEAIAASLGYTLEWRREAPFVCGVARVGHRIGGGRRIFTWEVRYEAGGANDALLEELLQSYAGGHGGLRLIVTAVHLTPPHATGLQLWLDPAGPDTSAVSGVVAQLGDRSGHGRHFTMATATRRPAFNTVDARFGRRPTLTFDGVDDYMASAAFNVGPSGACTIYVVAKTEDTHTGYIYGADSNGNPSVWRAGASVLQRYRVSGVDRRQRSKAVGNVVARMVGVFDGNTLADLVPAEFLDGAKNTGTVSTTGTLSALGITSAIHRLGSSGGASSFLNGTIAEVLAFDGMHTDQQVADVDAWLVDRYRRWAP